MRLLAICILALSMVPLSSAVVDLSGQSGRDALNSIESGSGLWNWGSAPLGHVVDDSQLLSGVCKDPGDISTMETPLQAQGANSENLIASAVSGGFSDAEKPAPAENKDWIPIVFSGFDDIQPLDKSMDKRAINLDTGIFDISSFKLPEPQFPRIY
jgi:hypothetical protein